MKRLLPVVLLCVVCAPAWASGPREAMVEYDAACAAGKGREAAALLAPPVVEFFEGVRKAALATPRSELEETEYLFQMQVILARAAFSASDLASWSGTGLFAAFVDVGAVEGAEARGLTPGEPVVTGDTAVIPMLLRGKPSPASIDAVRVDGRWLVDPMAGMRLGMTHLVNTSEAGGIAWSVHMEEFARQVSGDPDFDAWRPVGR